MAQGDIETYYEDGQWKNKLEGTNRAFGASYGTKDEAVVAGREAAQADKVEHVIKNQDGQISSKNRQRSPECPGLIATSPWPSVGWRHKEGPAQTRAGPSAFSSAKEIYGSA